MNTPDQVLTRLREVMDEIDTLNERLVGLQGERKAIEQRLAELHKTTGLTSFANDSVTVSIDPNAMRVGYEPEKWEVILKSFVDMGRYDLVHRRLSDAKILELLDSGEALPDGIKFEGYTKVSIRRK